MKLEKTAATDVYLQLIREFDARTSESVEARWEYLTAAHIVGQHHFGLHLASHGVMLAFAARNGDWPEVVGQLFRLALVPIGHLTGKLPIGNIGRATVSAFAPMPLDERSRGLLAETFRTKAERGELQPASGLSNDV
ncbi:DUF3703 domain-containing protein [Caenimonas sedimenti]|uniref:DUF3703 domain-containing protein n=1 Tax=Caenimonas sedimenti TaxID=2596921 RepID=A0A562ZI46_9BURK|nr:DUF3703 domain-containing protein [Caenimonas sedimenti]TWO68006.1 DUF3703 domain-containing protein [Caenimonas sedimenti]